MPAGGPSTSLTLRAQDHRGHGFDPGQFAWLRSPTSAPRAEDPSRIAFTVRGYETFIARVTRLPVGTGFQIDGPDVTRRLRVTPPRRGAEAHFPAPGRGSRLAAAGRAASRRPGPAEESLRRADAHGGDSGWLSFDDATEPPHRAGPRRAPRPGGHPRHRRRHGGRRERRRPRAAGRDPRGRRLQDVVPGGSSASDLRAWRTELADHHGVPCLVDVHRGPASGTGAVALLLRVAEPALLTESSQHLDAAFELAPIGTAFFNPAGEYVRVNSALCRLLDRTAQELLGRRDQDITHPDHRACDVAALVAVAWRAAGTMAEHRHARADADMYDAKRRTPRRQSFAGTLTATSETDPTTRRAKWPPSPADGRLA